MGCKHAGCEGCKRCIVNDLGDRPEVISVRAAGISQQTS